MLGFKMVGFKMLGFIKMLRVHIVKYVGSSSI